MKNLKRYTLNFILFLIITIMIFAIGNLSISMVMTGKLDVSGNDTTNQIILLLGIIIASRIISKLNNSKIWIKYFK